MPAEVWTFTNAEYHADPTKIGASMLKTALRSPAEYYGMYVGKKPDGSPLIPNEQTAAQLLGSVTHCLILEPENLTNLYWVRPHGIDGRTKEGKATLAKLAVQSLGKREIKAEMHEQAKRMTNAVLASDCCGVPFVDILAQAQKEHAIIWTEDDMTFKEKVDLFIARPEMDSDLILDIKTSDDPTPEEWLRGGQYAPIPKWRIDLQGAHYCTGRSEFTGRACTFGVIVVGSSEPHDVYAYDLGNWLGIGMKWRQRAIELVRRGLETGDWSRPEQHAVLESTPSQWDMI